MTNSEFMKILNDDSLELTVEELENIIEEELQKDESEMDPDLIEYCLTTAKMKRLSRIRKSRKSTASAARRKRY